MRTMIDIPVYMQDDTKSVRRMRLKRTKQYMEEQSTIWTNVSHESKAELVKGENLLHE